MSKLNKDVLFLTLVELQKDRKSLYSCLLVNRTWCETTIPILWKNPLKFCPTGGNKRILFDVILLHLSEESRDTLKNHEIDIFAELHQRPLFNYISFWRYLNLNILEKMIISAVKSKAPTIRSEILKLLINENTKITHIYMSTPLLNYQVHIISGAERCFSELKFLQINKFDRNSQNVLEGLARISKSVKKINVHITSANDISGIIKLIEAQKNLNDVQFSTLFSIYELPYKALEESLIKHADTIQHLQICWKPVTKIFSHLVNLISFDIDIPHCEELKNLDWGHLEVASLPDLKILKARGVPSKSLASLIENTKGHLTEISINYRHDDFKRLIQAIYQNCPKLMYIRLRLENSDISELEKLLTNCQCLNGLVILSSNHILREQFDWDNLFKVLTKSSPDCLFKFKFSFNSHQRIRLKSLRLLFESWKGRHPMLLQTIPIENCIRVDDYFDLIEKYKVEGIIKDYDNDLRGRNFEDFEWIQKNF